MDRDEHGMWLYIPVESLRRGTRGSKVDYCWAGWPDPPGAAMVQIIPHDDWWFARWQRTPESAHVAIDLCTPARLRAQTWTRPDCDGQLGATESRVRLRLSAAVDHVQRGSGRIAGMGSGQGERFLTGRRAPYR